MAEFLVNVEVGLALSTINTLIVSALSAPLKKKFKDTLDFWWLIYVNMATGFVISWFAGVNLFPASFVAEPVLGRVLTGLLVGGGAKIIYDLIKAVTGLKAIGNGKAAGGGQ